MSNHSNGWPIPVTGYDNLRVVTKRLDREERRGTPTSAADMLGPAMSAQAVHIIDWNDEVATFNGFVYTQAGGINAPEVLDEFGSPITGLSWAGQVIAREDGTGMQQAWNTEDPDSMYFRVRNFAPNALDPNAPPVFGEWRKFATKSGFIEDEDLHPVLSGTITDAYNNANAAAAAAAEAAATGTAALTAANGKNKVTYSANPPGSAPNAAGDIWFQRTGGQIIGQWEGMGGTSWQARTIAGIVIAYLDAGQLTAGSAFVNGLSVKTNFTLGDASTNGVIQSYNFAGSTNGVYIDKFGIVVKGGTISGSSITSANILSSSFSTTGVVGAGSNNAYMYGYIVGASAAGIIEMNPSYTGHGGFPSSALTMLTGGIAGALYFTGSFNMDRNLWVGGNFEATGTISNNGNITSSGIIHGFRLETEVSTTSNAANTHMDANGRLFKFVSSAAKYKQDIEPLTALTPETVLALEPKQWRYRPDYYDSPDIFYGFIADEAEALGLDNFVDYEDGEIENFNYARFSAAQQIALRWLADKVLDLTRRLEVLEGV